MCPARRTRRGTSSPKSSGDGRGKTNSQQDVPKPTLKSGCGWIVENYQYMKMLPTEKLLNGIHQIFAIPLQYKNDTKHIAVQVFTEYHINSFTFAQQFTDNGKALMVLMILSDYIGNIPSFSNSNESFSLWYEKTSKIIQNSEFTAQEQQAIMTFINTGLRPNYHLFHYILTHQEMKKLDLEGLKLFKPLAPAKKENADDDQANAPDPNAELEAQLAAAALAEKGAAEAEQKRIEMQQAVESMVNENMARIKSALDARNEQVVQNIFSTEDRVIKQAKQNK